jgi:Rrf2 family protein
MFRISKKGDYGIFLLSYLARNAGRVVSAQELTSCSGLSRSVVANVLKDLAKAGVLDSERGVHGGYRLARPAEQITLKVILDALEGPWSLVDCAHPSDAVGERCGLMDRCPSLQPMRVLQGRIVKMLRDTSLQDLAGTPRFDSFAAATVESGNELTTVVTPSGDR